MKLARFNGAIVKDDNLAKLDYATIGNTIQQVKVKSCRLDYSKTCHEKL